LIIDKLITSNIFERCRPTLCRVVALSNKNPVDMMMTVTGSMHIMVDGEADLYNMQRQWPQWPADLSNETIMNGNKPNPV